MYVCIYVYVNVYILSLRSHMNWEFCDEIISIGYTLKARWLSDLFNRVPKARGE